MPLKKYLGVLEDLGLDKFRLGELLLRSYQMQPSNTLKIESLDKGWQDKDNVLLHACFQLLKDCVEKENLLAGHIDWNADEKHQKVKLELEKLYAWWLKRLEKEDQCGLNKQQYEEDDRMLHQLIDIRWALWT